MTTTDAAGSPEEAPHARPRPSSGIARSHADSPHAPHDAHGHSAAPRAPRRSHAGDEATSNRAPSPSLLDGGSNEDRGSNGAAPRDEGASTPRSGEGRRPRGRRGGRGRGGQVRSGELRSGEG